MDTESRGCDACASFSYSSSSSCGHCQNYRKKRKRSGSRHRWMIGTASSFSCGASLGSTNAASSNFLVAANFAVAIALVSERTFCSDFVARTAALSARFFSRSVSAFAAINAACRFRSCASASFCNRTRVNNQSFDMEFD